LKYRVTKIEEVRNPLFGQLDGATKDDRAAQARQPQYLYHVDLITEGGHCEGQLTLDFHYAPMLAVGSVYTLEDIEAI
jgi:hypothetical protein